MFIMSEILLSKTFNKLILKLWPGASVPRFVGRLVCLSVAIPYKSVEYFPRLNYTRSLCTDFSHFCFFIVLGENLYIHT